LCAVSTSCTAHQPADFLSSVPELLSRIISVNNFLAPYIRAREPFPMQFTYTQDLSKRIVNDLYFNRIADGNAAA
jgi:hypothetical protein